jgi:hypothetical protein
MSDSVVSFKIDTEKKRQLQQLAEIANTTVSDLLRAEVDELLRNGAGAIPDHLGFDGERDAIIAENRPERMKAYFPQRLSSEAKKAFAAGLPPERFKSAIGYDPSGENPSGHHAEARLYGREEVQMVEHVVEHYRSEWTSDESEKLDAPLEAFERVREVDETEHRDPTEVVSLGQAESYTDALGYIHNVIQNDEKANLREAERVVKHGLAPESKSKWDVLNDAEETFGSE